MARHDVTGKASTGHLDPKRCQAASNRALASLVERLGNGGTTVQLGGDAIDGCGPDEGLKVLVASAPL